VAALHEHADALVEQVLAENAGRWESASPRDVVRVEAIARAVAKRLLHEPTIRLRSLSGEHGHASVELVRELFALRDGLERDGVELRDGAAGKRAGDEEPRGGDQDAGATLEDAQQHTPRLAQVHPLRRRA
jgi:hypothetical protein